MTEHAFQAFRLSPDVCEICGELVGSHVGGYVEYEAAMRRVLLRHGIVPSFYGGTDVMKTLALRLHLGQPIPQEWERELAWMRANDRYEYRHWKKRCSPDWSRMGVPQEDKVEEFNGTFNSSPAYRYGVMGHVFCKCGDLSYETLIMDNKTVGQIIWLMTQEGRNDA